MYAFNILMHLASSLKNKPSGVARSSSSKEPTNMEPTVMSGGVPDNFDSSYLIATLSDFGQSKAIIGSLAMLAPDTTFSHGACPCVSALGGLAEARLPKMFMWHVHYHPRFAKTPSSINGKLIKRHPTRRQLRATTLLSLNHS